MIDRNRVSMMFFLFSKTFSDTLIMCGPLICADDSRHCTFSILRYLCDNTSSIRRNLTKMEISTALMILKAKHKLTTSAITDICSLLHLLKVSKVPKSFAAVKRILTSTNTNHVEANLMHICSTCNSVFDKSCSNLQCQSNSDLLESATFLKFPIKKQIQSILAVEKNLTLHSLSSVNESNWKSDIQHGDWYRSILSKEGQSNVITLLLNVDGVSVSESSDKSLWVFTVSKFIFLKSTNTIFSFFFSLLSTRFTENIDSSYTTASSVAYGQVQRNPPEIKPKRC